MSSAGSSWPATPPTIYGTTKPGTHCPPGISSSPAACDGLTVRGEGMGLGLVRHTSAVLSNGLGRYRDALTAAEEASASPQELGFANWGLAELVEAAVRCRETTRAADALERLARTTRPSGTPWGLG